MDFIKIPGNYQYEISKDLVIRKKLNTIKDLNVVDGKVNITLYGITRSVEVEWLYWISYYCVEMPVGYEKEIFNVLVFDNLKIRNINTEIKILVFKEPVYVDKDKLFRLIPRHTNYAINCNGDVLNIKTGVEVKRINNGDYSQVILYDKSYAKSTNIKTVHRLVAINWIPNDDYVNYGIVNHKDGNKKNPHSTNLEWVSHSGNVRHAIVENLKSDVIKVVTKNIATDEVLVHQSMTDAMIYIGRTRANLLLTPLAEDRVWRGTRGEFEIKLLDDPRPWFFVKESKPDNVNQKIKVFVTNNGVTQICNNSSDLRKLFLPNQPIGMVSSYKDIITRYKKYNPEAHIHVKILDQYASSDEYIIKEVKTGKTEIFTSRKDITEYTGIPKSSLQKSIASDGAYEFNGWVAKVNNGKPFAELANIENRSISISIKNVITNKEEIFTSQRQASEFLRANKIVIKNALQSGKLFKGIYKITSCPPTEKSVA